MMTIIGRLHKTPTARKICTCGVFATSSCNFGLPTYFVSHYMLCSMEEFFFNLENKVEQSCLTVVHSTVMSEVTHMLYGVRGVDTMFMFCSFG